MIPFQLKSCFKLIEQYSIRLSPSGGSHETCYILKSKGLIPTLKPPSRHISERYGTAALSMAGGFSRMKLGYPNCSVRRSHLPTRMPGRLNDAGSLNDRKRHS